MQTKETWKPIPGFDGYEASDLGRVRSWRMRFGVRASPIVRSPYSDRRGYLRMTVMAGGRKQLRGVHQLVARAFLGTPPKNSIINHKDADKKNNKPNNLEYCTALENVRHADTLALRRPWRKIEARAVREIRMSFIAGSTMKILSARYTVSTQTIFRIVSYRSSSSWDLDLKKSCLSAIGRPRIGLVLSPELVDILRTEYANGSTSRELATKHRLNLYTVRNALRTDGVWGPRFDNRGRGIGNKPRRVAT